MDPYRFFQFCPRCGGRQVETPANPQFKCSTCGFVYYFNPANAAAAFVFRPDDHVLFIRRAKEPSRGKLAIPGGFIDIGETAEQALRREIREEVNLEIESMEYCCSFPNQYFYREVTYPVLDLFFVARVTQIDPISALDDVESLCWLRLDRVNPDEIAFPSIRNALEYLRGARR